MVAVFSEPHNQTTLFPYLKSCQPAPGIVNNFALPADPLASPAKLTKRRGRLLNFLFGAAHAAAIGIGCWAPSLWQNKPVMIVASAETVGQQLEADLWQSLGSDDLAEVLLAAKEQQTEERLAAAEQARLQAQQLRISAEEQAENLVTDAANRARKTTLTAVRQADAVRLDATYVGAEQIIYAEAGDDITLKFAARVQCKEGSFGETATATPVDPRIVPREVRNLANCYPKAETAAGQSIGAAGEWGIAFFELKP